jgi:hypothetical protein
MTANASPIPVTYFGMTIESPNYNYAYEGGPVETETTIPVSIVRSWDVWSPGNGQVEYLDWSDLNPSSGVYNWTALNAWIATNQATNTQMVYTFGDPPAWAGGTTTNLADFQAFVTAVVTQANGAIKYWEGFNEFDVSGIAPALLVQMQEIIYNTVHTLDPGGLVLSPTVSGAGSDPQFAQFLADGGGKYFDIAAFHGYNNSTGEGIIPVVQDFQALLTQYGLSNVPIWDTEWGMEAPTVITDTTTQRPQRWPAWPGRPPRRAGYQVLPACSSHAGTDAPILRHPRRRQDHRAPQGADPAAQPIPQVREPV